MKDLPENAPRRDLMKFLATAAVGGAVAGVADAQSPVPAPAPRPARTIAGEVTAAVASGRVVPAIGSSYWAHPQDGIFLPAGTYTASSIALTKGPNAPLAALALWAVPGSVVIEIAAGEYLFDIAERLNWFHAHGITFIGGAGVFRHRFEGDNVNGRIAFDTCVFDGYTQCAIGNNARDAPYLRVRDCMFMAAPGAPAIGVAWGGWADSVIIEENSFLRNRYHVKLGPRIGSTVRIARNDFLKWDRATKRAADLWLVPNEDPGSYGSLSGQGTTITENKFGNEHLDPDDVRILIAAEGPGKDRLTRGHADRWILEGAKGGYVSGITIADCLIAASDGVKAPLIRSHIAGLRSLTYRGNRHIGGRYAWLCEFTGPRPAAYTETDWAIAITAGEALPGGLSPFVRGISNRVIGPVADPDGLFLGAPGAYPPSGSGDAGRIVVQATSAAAFDAVGTTLRDVGAMAEVRLDRADGGVAIAVRGAAEDALTWLQLDLASGTGPTPGEIIVEVRQDGGFSLAHRFTSRADALVCQRFILPAPIGPAPVYLLIRAGAGSAIGQTFRIGDLIVNQGPIPVRRGDLRVDGARAGQWNGPHLVLGSLHMWDHAGRAFVKSGAPTGPTDGTPISGTR